MPLGSLSMQAMIRAVQQGTAAALMSPATPETPYVLGGSQVWTNGTGSGAADRIVAIGGTLVSTTQQIDLSGSLTDIYGASVSFVEARALIIRNTSEAAAKVLKLGGGANPAYSGLFAASGDIVIIPAVGPTGLPWIWSAGYDGGGLAVTGGTGDILTLDSGAQTVTFEGLIIGVSA